MSLSKKYKETVIKELSTKFGYANVMAVPKILKVTVNVGVGRHMKDKKYIEEVVDTITRITGQKPVICKSKKSIAAFKVKAGDPVGVATTMRGARMWDFLDKLINVTFPRVRDFHGVTRTVVDRDGNLSVGFKEQISFPEVRFDRVENIHGLEVTVATTAKTRAEGFELFQLLGFPFQKEEVKSTN
jgi:large subunit ribosomal protein L5